MDTHALITAADVLAVLHPKSHRSSLDQFFLPACLSAHLGMHRLLSSHGLYLLVNIGIGNSPRPSRSLVVIIPLSAAARTSQS
jgi:hypothetical protein